MKSVTISDLRLRELWERIRRGVLYGLYLLGFLLLQNVVFSHIAPLGVRAMFMPALVAAVALFEGGHRGGLFGLAAGIACDMFFFGQRVLFTVLFPVMAFGIGLLADFYLNRRFFTYAILGVLAVGLCPDVPPAGIPRAGLLGAVARRHSSDAVERALHLAGLLHLQDLSLEGGGPRALSLLSDRKENPCVN